jgi:hypothetical protein
MSVAVVAVREARAATLEALSSSGMSRNERMCKINSEGSVMIGAVEINDMMMIWKP